MLDQDMIRLQEKVNTVLEYRERQEILQDAEEKELSKRLKKMRKEKLRDKLELGVLISIFVVSIISLSPSVQADELVHKFKSPSFSGIGTSSHYLTIENQEKSRTDKIAEDIRKSLFNVLNEKQKILFSQNLSGI